jgi:hypothetical protein
MSTQAVAPKKRTNILLTLGLAAIPVFMYAATWLKDWS